MHQITEMCNLYHSRNNSASQVCKIRRHVNFKNYVYRLINQQYNGTPVL